MSPERRHRRSGAHRRSRLHRKVPPTTSPADFSTSSLVAPNLLEGSDRDPGSGADLSTQVEQRRMRAEEDGEGLDGRVALGPPAPEPVRSTLLSFAMAVLLALIGLLATLQVLRHRAELGEVPTFLRRALHGGLDLRDNPAGGMVVAGAAFLAILAVGLRGGRSGRHVSTGLVTLVFVVLGLGGALLAFSTFQEYGGLLG